MKILVASHKIQLLSFQATRSLVLFVLPHYERVKSTRIRWKSDFHLPRPEVELNFSIELIAKRPDKFAKRLDFYTIFVYS